MKTEIQKYLKIMDITREMFEMDPEYFADCLFNMYYQMKKKNTVDLYCKENPTVTVKQVWSTMNFMKSMTSKGQPIEDALFIACNHYETDPSGIKSLINKFQAFKSTKKTKFKDLV